MRNEWLAASSFEHMQHIIAAITTLSIHTKLVLGGHDDPTDYAEIQCAQKDLRNFLDQLQRCVQDGVRNPTGMVVGTDPRFGELASRYLLNKRQCTEQSPLYTCSFDEAKHLLESLDHTNLQTRIAYLHDLRALLEQHAQADVIGLLGDI